MFVREKTVNGYTYLYLVETVREDGRTKQRIIRNLGRKEAVLASGCQSAFNIDPQSACKIDPPERHGGGCPGSQ